MVHTAWEAAEESCEPQKQQSPENGHTSDFLSGNVVGVGAAELAWSSVIVVATDGDDGRASLHGWLGHEAGLLSVHGLHGLSVHGLHGLHGLTVHWGLSVHWVDYVL